MDTAESGRSLNLNAPTRWGFFFLDPARQVFTLPTPCLDRPIKKYVVIFNLYTADYNQ